MAYPSTQVISLMANTAATAINVGGTGAKCYFVAPVRCIVQRFGLFVTDAVANTASIVLDKTIVATNTENAAEKVVTLTAANNQYQLFVGDVSNNLIVNAGEQLVINCTATGTGTRTAIPFCLVRVSDDTLTNQDAASAALTVTA